MAKRRKAAAKKVAKKSSKGRAKKAAAGHKRTARKTSHKPKANMGFFDQLLSMFAGPDTRKT
jgi:hypothetical protein